MREWIARAIDWMRRDRLDRELQDELRFHREHLERDAVRSGVSREEAPYTARRKLGSVTRVTEAARERWSLPSLDQVLQDVRYALRGLRRSPGFTTTAVVTLALGIGANVAMFGVIDRLMFRPYSYTKDPGTVHRIYLVDTRSRGRVIQPSGIEYLRYLDLQRTTSSFSRMAVFAHPLVAIGVGDAARERRIAVVSATYWEFFDAQPVLGRFFTPAEDVPPRGADVAVLAHDFWRSDFGSRNVIGETIRVGAMTATIIGVAPQGFTSIVDADQPAVFVPVTTFAASNGGPADRVDYYKNYDWGWLAVMARLKPEVTAEQATVDASRAYWQSWEAERLMVGGDVIAPAEIAQPAAFVSAMKVAAGPDPTLEARTALWLFGVAGIVLLIACANVANLFLARALRRQREIAVRLALGVSRGRLMLQTLTESLVLSFVGSVGGLLVAYWGGAAIRRLLIAGPNAPSEVFTDWRTLAVVLGVAFVAALLTGLAPALLSGRGDLAKTLKAGAREGTYARSHTRTTLLVAQGALSVVLLVGAALFVRSLENVRDMRMGYDAERTFIVARNFRGMTLDSAQRVEQRRALVAAAQGIPGVAYAAWVSSVPLQSTGSTTLFVPAHDDGLLQGDGHAPAARAWVHRRGPARRAASRCGERDDGQHTLAGTRPDRAVHQAAIRYDALRHGRWRLRGHRAA
jgi:putative ABC transport system permease protein